ncbi:unnamed protein product, partial [Medioppia subpectinata]
MSVVMSYLYDFDVGQRTACIDRLNGTQTARTASARLALRLAAKDLAVSENVKLLFFVNSSLGFLALAATVLTIPIEIRVFINEHRNRWYSTGAYYWSKCLVELPVLTLIGVIYSTMVYFISDQESDAFRWAYFTMIVAFINEKNVLTIGLILSANGLAPKVLGVFDTGIILEFINGRYFGASDDQNPIAVSLLGQKLAKLHSLEMPVIKDNSQNRMNSMFSDNYFSPKLRQSLKEGAVYEEIMRNNYQTFQTLDLSTEMSWLKPIILDLKSPIVFTHNDFNRKNILIRETNDENPQQMDIYFIDFDFSSYNYRGIDFGTYFSSWCHREIPYGFGDYPTDDQMLVFIDAYIREMTAINGNSFTQLEINSRQRLIKEAKVDGFINKIYYCFLPEDSNNINDNKVVFRCHDHNEWQAFINEKNVLTISLLLSAKGLAPKVLGVFDTGIILQFIDGRYFGASDDINPRAVSLLGQKLATLHSMEMPFIKDNSQNRLNGILGDNYFDHKLRQSFIDGLVYKEINKHHYKALQTLDLLAEMSWLKQMIVDLKSPIVFSHNDFNRKNILIRETNDENSQQMDIYFIDFDFSSYNYRGTDFGTYFSNWCHREIPFGFGAFPTDDQMLVFIDAYIREMTAINGNSFTQLEINSRQRLIKEAKVFALLTFIINTIFCIHNAVNHGMTKLLCRYFTGSDDHNPRAVALLAQRLARLHTTEMPVPKDNTKMWLNSNFGDNNWFDDTIRQSLKEGLVYQEIQRHQYETLQTLDLLAEMSWLKKIVVDLKSPIVFSHNDFNRKNILMRETNDENSQQMDIYLIDFDFSSYTYRGIDLGNYFGTWGQKWPNYDWEEFPTDDQMLVFIDAYIREMTAINGNSFTQLEINSRQRLIKDIVTTEDRHKVYDLCKTHLSGKWAEVSEHELIIRHNTQGFMNKLFYCFLPENIDTPYNKVVVRYNDYQAFEGYYQCEHVVAISVILSEIGLSPKLLSVFGEGTIIEFIESRHFNADDYLSPKTVTKLAQKLATFHSLTVPVPKNSAEHTRSNIFDKWFDQKFRLSVRSGAVRKHIVAANLATFLRHDFVTETDWFQRAVRDLQSPIVFSHNDFNRRNILIRETRDNNNTTGSAADNTDNTGHTMADIYLIDFDWSNYNYRGLDFGQYFSRFGQLDTDFGAGDFPTDRQMWPFIDAYIDKMCDIYGNSYAELEINSRDVIIKETKVLALLAYIKDILYCMDCVTTADSPEMM